MPQSAPPQRRSEQARFGILIFLIAACFLGGGASRVDVMSLLYLQPLAVICLVALVLTPGAIEWHRIRAPLLMLGGLAAIMVAQLIPLPPPLWAALPGHEPFMEIARGVGADDVWRPISLTPDLTLAALVGLIVPATVLVGFAAIPRTRSYNLLPVLLAGAVLSVLIGLAQVAGGEGSALYLYNVTSRGLPVGLFSNRNHQALLIVMTWPMLAAWAAATTVNRSADYVRRGVALATGLLLLPSLLITGSRAGLAMAPLALLLAFVIWRGHGTLGLSLSAGARKLALGLGLGAIALVIVGAVVLSRDEAIRRFLELSFEDESRLQHVPVLLRVLGDFFPLGSGFGSFDPIYRFYEPDDLLDPTYLNHAHNDLLEIVITGGLPALVLLLLFLGWVARCTFAAWRERSAGRGRALAWLGAGMIFFAMSSSIVDYPLRTPLMAALVAVACGWIGQVRLGKSGQAQAS